MYTLHGGDEDEHGCAAREKTGQKVINYPYTSFEFFDRNIGKMALTAGEHELMYRTSFDTKDFKITKIKIQ